MREQFRVIRDLFSKMEKYGTVFQPSFQIKVLRGLTADNIKTLLQMVLGEDIGFIACIDGCDDVCIKDGGRVFLYRECPDCRESRRGGKRLIQDTDYLAGDITAGLVYSCPYNPLIKYHFVDGQLKKIEI